jgi:hypothetical protein
MKWNDFFEACILAVGLLLKAGGGPIVPIVLGIAGAAFFKWRKHRSE